MKNEKLREIIEKLEMIKNLSNQGEISRLITYLAELKEVYPKYTDKVNGIFDIIQRQINGCGSVYETDYARRELIKILKEDEEKGDVILETLKDTYAEAKDIASQAIPEVKATCSKVITTVGNIGRGFAETINKEIPQISEGIGKVKATSKKAKKEIKSKIREWALSDDEK